MVSIHTVLNVDSGSARLKQKKRDAVGDVTTECVKQILARDMEKAANRTA